MSLIESLTNEEIEERLSDLYMQLDVILDAIEMLEEEYNNRTNG